MQGQVKKIFSNSNAKKTRAIIISVKLFTDDDRSGEHSCDATHRVMNLQVKRSPPK